MKAEEELPIITLSAQEVVGLLSLLNDARTKGLACAAYSAERKTHDQQFQLHQLRLKRAGIATRLDTVSDTYVLGRE